LNGLSTLFFIRVTMKICRIWMLETGFQLKPRLHPDKQVIGITWVAGKGG
jgi:hypothetical protein